MTYKYTYGNLLDNYFGEMRTCVFMCVMSSWQRSLVFKASKKKHDYVNTKMATSFSMIGEVSGVVCVYALRLLLGFLLLKPLYGNE